MKRELDFVIGSELNIVLLINNRNGNIFENSPKCNKK